MGETQLSKLQVAQNRAMRVILQCKRSTEVECMLQALQFMSVKQRLFYNTCLFVFKMSKGMLTEMLKDRTESVGETSDRQTRQHMNIALQMRKTSNAQKSLFYEGVKMFNSLPRDVKNSALLPEFKRKLRDYVINM